MAERKAPGSRAPRGRRSGDDGGAKGSGDDAALVTSAAAEPDPSPAVNPHDPGKVKVRAGGFVTTADAPAPTPEPIIPCSVCGQTLVDEGDGLVCPRGHGRDKSGGWMIADEDEDQADEDDGSDEEG